MLGQTFGHYRIVEKIGAGGMGEVYRARDEHLGRDVAIKVLPAGTLADQAARKRFRKEALSLSKLNHPNIETVHDFDTQEGVDFLVMEHVPGVTLSEKLRSGALPEKEIAQFGAQIAEGLAAAHKENVIHRDIKPGNLRVTPEGRLKILDFGLAKLVKAVSQATTTDSLSETQGVAGTLPYMAPEQLRGEPVDARTDIHALGAVLYEMATGQRPFRDELAPQVTDAILHQAPVTPRALNPKVSPELERIVLKCLEKEPENRYQSATELAVDLRRTGAPTATPLAPSPRPAPRSLAGAPAWGKSVRRALPWGALALVVLLAVLAGLNVGGIRERLLGGATPPPGKIMLAVLPFDNLSADPEQEYFSDGLTEEMIAQLGRLQPKDLGVIARTSVMQYKGTQKQIDQIGRELNVDYVLEGSVRLSRAESRGRKESRLRITAQLIQVRDQTHLWAESYERNLADVFAIQSGVAERIARSLAMELLPAAQARLARAPTSNAEAHQAYLKGRYFWNKRTGDGFKKAMEQFQRAIELDPGYALAHAGVADTYILLGNYGVLPHNEAKPKAKAAARKALELDETLAEAHTSLAGVMGEYEWDWLGAEREFRRALELNPNYATARQWHAAHLAMMGRPEEGILEIKKAQELDPLSLRINVDVARAYYFARQYDQAIEQCQKALELDPSFTSARYQLGLSYVEKGLYEEAIAELEKAAGGGLSMWLGYTYAVAGKRQEALAMLDRWKELWKKRGMGASAVALIYVGLGEKDQAFPWLEKALEQRSGMTTLKSYPYWAPLRSDPRFQDLLRRMNFPE
ncbi:MAG: protein kinase [Terriglobia bacterium]